MRDAPAPPAAWLRNVAMTVLGVAVVLCISEGVVRASTSNAFLTPPVFRPAQTFPGYALATAVSTDVWQFGRPIAVSTDASAHRLTVGAPDAATTTVHLVGDSQVFGWGLSDEETIASRLQQRLGRAFRVVNHGVPGYWHRQYVAVAASAPAGDMVIVVHTEENDGADALGLVPASGSTCGMLTGVLASEWPGLCPLLALRLVQGALVQVHAAEHSRHLTPLGFSGQSEVAGATMYFRISNAYEALRPSRSGTLLFTVIPWKGRFSRTWRGDSAPEPSPQSTAMDSPLPDDLVMVGRFARLPDPEALYLPSDSHLSPRGADLVADAIARRILNESGAL